MNRRNVRNAVFLTSMALLTVGVANAQGPASSSQQGLSAAQQSPASMAKPTDRQLARSVRKAIRQAGGIDMAALSVRAKNGVVTLAGTVPSAIEANKAAELAKGVSGVVSVRNKLNVQTEEN